MSNPFGRLMTKVGIIICANLMFILFSLPVVTIGASFTALYRVMFKTMRSGGVTNPFKQFWIGFKSNFLQSTIVWVAYAALMVLLYFDVRICANAGPPIRRRLKEKSRSTSATRSIFRSTNRGSFR